MVPVWMSVALALVTGTPAAGGDADFDALARIQGGPVLIAPRAPEASEALPEVAPDAVLTTPTIRAVIARERATLWACHAALRGPRRFVLDLSIRANGRVRDVRVRPDPPSSLEGCALEAALRWRFPRFTGERADGRTVELVNASVPIEFVTPNAE